jgi:hypothetical protein
VHYCTRAFAGRSCRDGVINTDQHELDLRRRRQAGRRDTDRAHHRLMRGKAEAVGVLGRFRDADLNRRDAAVPGRRDGIGERLRGVLEPPLPILELGDHAG